MMGLIRLIFLKSGHMEISPRELIIFHKYS